ncbi:valine--tRNA ligase [candidate division WWE3 bacterium RIFCSPLOWO2_01_FULL_53_14]|uniref:Valine--tRNA ligase n=1 Tax=candidate division WWE3 bacterium RIFCSPLOWO2_01_FULL_53_14 TaxID=1802628 RepID=A0A1F4VS65_UNCKA|nr:MAG: valine--tRNA ligase [candidate division WWE3 bacterium RIFCSPLOWO2_01_FULL_53_14]
MDKVFDPGSVEKKIYEKWERSGVFSPSVALAKEGASPFCIIMPPPNANEDLHIGHARFVTIEDVLIRYHRMKGEPTLWLPGADHAGIETQYVFEKKLKDEGKSRFDFDRETLYQMIWDYSMEKKSRMESQLRALGASCDWTRNKFTLDPAIIKIVYRTFKKLFAEGLVYRGNRLVNYCTHCGTAYSNLEVDHVERTDPLYFMKYGPFTLATVRPETKFGDTAVAVNPKDKRYTEWIDKEIEVDGLLGKFKIKVIADGAVDPEFGTGVVKVTPAHDPVDWEMGRRHNLEIKQVIGLDGRLNEKAGRYQRLTVKEARRVVVEDLQKAGLLDKVDENYKHSVAICYRCKSVIEPLPMEQWFLKVAPLVKKALTAMGKGEVRFTAKRFDKIARHWYANLYDWNISRQIVWGMRIPAWRCEKCGEWTITAGETPDGCSKCKSKEITQDSDTFDTWFSSGQWPYATLMSGKSKVKSQKLDFEYFYPTSVMETAYDIIPFWVIRMIMLGLYETGKVPFREVLIHGLVRDKEGQKISKSKGNVIDPLVMVERYGADALRMGVVWGAKVESDIALSEENIRGQRNFANKIWNVARFVLMDRAIKKAVPNEDDRKIRKELELTVKSVTKALDTYRLNEAVEGLYEFVWHKFADVYLEKTKSRRAESQPTLELVLKESLKLLHPFMPFVTEAIWEELGEKEMLITSPWPEAK